MGNQKSQKKTDQYGIMHIELYDGIGLVAGDYAWGTIHIKQNKPFKANALTIGLFGEEYLSFLK